MDNTRFFYLGGIASFGVYGILFFLFFFDTFFFDSPQRFIPNGESYIEVNVVDGDPKKSQSPIQNHIEPSQDIAHSEKENVSLDSLFEDVEGIKSLKEKEKKVKTQEVLTRLKQLESKANTAEKTSKLVDEIAIAKSSIKFSSNNNIKNSYFDNVYKVIASRFKPTAEDARHQCVVVLKISKFGKLTDFRITRSSGDKAFDDRFVGFLERLKGVDFDKNEKDVTIEFTFTIEG